jgi:hypothetical protein
MKFTFGKILTAAIATALATNAFAGGTEDHGKLPHSVATEMHMMDLDTDGRVSAAEHAAGAKRMFKTMDRNQDTRVTAAEMDAAHQTLQPGKTRDGYADRKAKTEMSSTEKIKVVDTDHDVALTAQEHAAGSESMFSKMDLDRDGFLTLKEMEAGHTKMMTASDD